MVKWIMAMGMVGLGCGPSGPTLNGIVNVAVSAPGESATQLSPWFPGSDLPLQTPPGSGAGFWGSCTHSGTTWTLDIHQAANFSDSIRGMQLTVADGSSQANVNIFLDQGTFLGICSVAPNTWSESHDLGLAGDCPMLADHSSAVTVDASMAMRVSNCTGQN